MENSRLNNSMGLQFWYKYYGLDKTLREIKPPYKNLDFAIVDLGKSLAIVLKEEQVMVLNGEQQVAVMEWVQSMRKIVESHGIKCDILGRRANVD